MWNSFIKFIRSWLAGDPFTQSGAVAYYAVFSMPGLLIIVMAIAALFFEQQQVEEEILGHIRNVLGVNAAESVDKIIDETQAGNRDLWAMVIGAVTLLFGSMGVFLQLQRSLNHIWEVEVKKTVNVTEFIKARATALGVILAIGFLLLISLALTAALALLSEWLASRFSPDFVQLISILNVLLSFFTVTFLFALIFRILPDAQVKWRDAFYGGALSAVLFNIGEYALTYYFEITKPQSVFGAAGSVILLMLWMSYSCLILLLGAEFTKIYAEKRNGCKAPATTIAKKKIHKQ